VYSLTSYDLWKATPPDDDGEAWALYEDKYLAAATRLLVAHLTETLPPTVTPRDRAAACYASSRPAYQKSHFQAVHTSCGKSSPWRP
jgi:hypothetical protein